MLITELLPFLSSSIVIRTESEKYFWGEQVSSYSFQVKLIICTAKIKTTFYLSLQGEEEI